MNSAAKQRRLLATTSIPSLSTSSTLEDPQTCLAVLYSCCLATQGQLAHGFYLLRRFIRNRRELIEQQELTGTICMETLTPTGSS